MSVLNIIPSNEKYMKAHAPVIVDFLLLVIVSVLIYFLIPFITSDVVIGYFALSLVNVSLIIIRCKYDTMSDPDLLNDPWTWFMVLLWLPALIILAISLIHIWLTTKLNICSASN